jgi:hypothetical protein
MVAPCALIVSVGDCDGCRAEFVARRSPSWLPIALEFAEQNRVLFESKEGGEDHMLPRRWLPKNAYKLPLNNHEGIRAGDGIGVGRENLRHLGRP